MPPTEVTWQSLLMLFSEVFTKPSFLTFQELAQAWILCPGRHTVTRMLCTMIPGPRLAHDAYHRLLRCAAWDMTELWAILVRWLVPKLFPTGDVFFDLDDTLFHKSGRKVEGAGTFRDAVRSTSKRVVYALGLNLVVVTLRFTPPWGGEPLGLPVCVRLHRKKGPNLHELAVEMIKQLAEWLPGRRLLLCGDGAYASLAGDILPELAPLTSRMRRDAALFDLPRKRRKGRRGRPAKKGKRLGTPEEMASRIRKGWHLEKVNFRGEIKKRLLYARVVLWYQVCKDRPVLLVIVRDPARREPDDFFFSTDPNAKPLDVANQYAGRWSIEDTNRNAKQYLGGEDPQTWKGKGPERAASLSMWLYSVVWSWYLANYGTKKTWIKRPWYSAKRVAAFGDALAALRRVLWLQSISSRSGQTSITPKILRGFLEVLVTAA